MDTLQSMKVFRRVVDAGSFVAAARALDVSTAMASKHVAHLEKRLGTRLLNRSSRHLSLTDAGRVYFEQVRDALDNLESAELAVGQTAVAPRGVLKITAPVWFANAHFARLLSAYRARYPDVVLDVSLSDRVVDLVEEGFDLALRVTTNPGSALIARPLHTIRFRFVAAPAYVAARGLPRTPQEVAAHATIGYTYSPFGDHFPLETKDGVEQVPFTPSLRTNNTTLTYSMVLAGMALAALPPWLVDEDIAAGRLVEALAPHRIAATTLYAVYTSRRYLAPKVRTFVDHMASSCAGVAAEVDAPVAPIANTAKVRRK
ncbi:MAG TPA: LysR family transcriptional regulator [Casimicrobiaceae bacterium]